MVARKKSSFTNRVKPVTNEQQEFLLECIEDHPILLTKAFTTIFSREKYNREWEHISAQLNELSQESARPKDKWQKVIFKN